MRLELFNGDLLQRHKGPLVDGPLRSDSQKCWSIMFVYISSELESCSMAASETYSMMSPYMAHVDLAPSKVCVHSIINYRRGCAPISTPLDSM
jgi:hypothetical protein